VRAEDHLHSVRGRFSAGSKTYDAWSGVQRRAGEALVRLLDETAPGSRRSRHARQGGLCPAPPGRILDVGCGTGALTRLLAARFPGARIDAVDLSERMIEEARAAWTGPDHVRWLAADVMTADLPPGFDLIASGSALHWLRPLDTGAARLAAWLAPGGALAASLMVEGTLEELHRARLRAAPRKPPLARLPSERDVLAALAGAGLTVEISRLDRYRVHAPTARDLLRALHLQGSTGGVFSRSEVPLTRGEIDALCREYEARDREAEGVAVTYVVASFVARRDGV
jgi:malonyl-CoA O-methyltransferase